jgi:hypothetical protein
MGARGAVASSEAAGVVLLVDKLALLAQARATIFSRLHGTSNDGSVANVSVTVVVASFCSAHQDWFSDQQ